jgi:biopolymer transport protein ExbB
MAWGGDLAVLTALTLAAPLLGLAGTVSGIMQSFGQVAAGADRDFRLISAGIGEALIATQTGLLVAIPGAFAIASCRQLARRRAVSAEITRARA